MYKKVLIILVYTLLVISLTSAKHGKGFSLGSRSHKSHKLSKSKSHSSSKSHKTHHDTPNVSSPSNHEIGFEKINRQAMESHNPSTLSKANKPLSESGNVGGFGNQEYPKNVQHSYSNQQHFGQQSGQHQFYGSNTYPRQTHPQYHSNSYYGSNAFPSASTTYVHVPTVTHVYSYRDHSDNSLLGYYLGYTIGSISHHHHYHHHHHDIYDDDTTYRVHHYYHRTREIEKKVIIKENAIVPCAQNISLCTQNTRPLCFKNGTIFCVSIPELTITCGDENLTLACVNSTVPCKNLTDTNCNRSTNTTSITIPCLSSATFTEDVNVEGIHSSTTLKQISGTFIVVPKEEQKPISYCVTIIAEPHKNDNQTETVSKST